MPVAGGVWLAGDGAGGVVLKVVPWRHGNQAKAVCLCPPARKIKGGAFIWLVQPRLRRREVLYTITLPQNHSHTQRERTAGAVLWHYQICHGSAIALRRHYRKPKSCGARTLACSSG